MNTGSTNTEGMSNSGGILKRVRQSRVKEEKSTGGSPIVVARGSHGLGWEQTQCFQKAGKTELDFQHSPHSLKTPGSLY